MRSKGDTMKIMYNENFKMYTVKIMTKKPGNQVYHNQLLHYDTLDDVLSFIEDIGRVEFDKSVPDKDQMRIAQTYMRSRK